MISTSLFHLCSGCSAPRARRRWEGRGGWLEHFRWHAVRVARVHSERQVLKDRFWVAPITCYFPTAYPWPGGDAAEKLQKNCRKTAEKVRRHCRKTEKKLQKNWKKSSETLQKNCRKTSETLQKKCGKNFLTLPKKFLFFLFRAYRFRNFKGKTHAEQKKNFFFFSFSACGTREKKVFFQVFCKFSAVPRPFFQPFLQLFCNFSAVPRPFWKILHPMLHPMLHPNVTGQCSGSNVCGQARAFFILIIRYVAAPVHSNH